MSEQAVKKPIDVATRETVAFVTSHLLSGAAVLEVGCGAGHVAWELVQHGYRVLGLDSDPQAIAQAQARGVPAVRAAWPEHECAPVDALAFTRSLHHINPLRTAVLKARQVLQPRGTLLVEDFAFDEANEVTVHWFLEVLGSQSGKALIAPVLGAFVTALLGAKDPAAVWHQEHDHELHTIATMTQVIAEHFVIRETHSVPYLYRYLVPVLPETPEATAFVEAVFREEARLGGRGEVVLIGRRIVGTPLEDVAQQAATTTERCE